VFDSMSDMAQSLYKLASLPEATEVYCGHEYTLANLRFAMAVEPGNAALMARNRAEQAKRDRGQPTSPSTIVQVLQARTGLPAGTPSESFAALRSWKDSF
jgi:hydroxyacylglutathione hydrolase